MMLQIKVNGIHKKSVIDSLRTQLKDHNERIYLYRLNSIPVKSKRDRIYSLDLSNRQVQFPKKKQLLPIFGIEKNKNRKAQTFQTLQTYYKLRHHKREFSKYSKKQKFHTLGSQLIKDLSINTIDTDKIQRYSSQAVLNQLKLDIEPKLYPQNSQQQRLFRSIHQYIQKKTMKNQNRKAKYIDKLDSKLFFSKNQSNSKFSHNLLNENKQLLKYGLQDLQINNQKLCPVDRDHIRRQNIFQNKLQNKQLQSRIRAQSEWTKRKDKKINKGNAINNLQDFQVKDYKQFKSSLGPWD